MTDELEPLDQELVDVLAPEREPRPAPAGSRDRVLERLDRSIGGGLAPLPGAGTGTGGSMLLRYAPLATLGIGIAIGAAWSPRERTVVVERPAPSMTVAEAPVATSAPVSEAPSASMSAAPPAKPAPKPSASNIERDDLGQERSMLDATRTALLRRDHGAALAMLERHAARHPHGRLAEERDALMVQALALAGRREEARARSDAFAKQYPQSLFLPTVRAALQGNGP